MLDREFVISVCGSAGVSMENPTLGVEFHVLRRMGIRGGVCDVFVHTVTLIVAKSLRTFFRGLQGAKLILDNG